MLQFYVKGFTFKNRICLPVEKIEITAFKAEGFSYATCKPLKPPQDFPYMPTDPLLQDWFDIHSKNRGAQALRALDPSHVVTRGYVLSRCLFTRHEHLQNFFYKIFYFTLCTIFTCYCTYYTPSALKSWFHVTALAEPW